jgi:hypothetical protein
MNERRILIISWILQIIAASFGLFLALARIITAHQSSSDEISVLKLSTDALLAGLPFFAVAMVELTKIPLINILFSKKSTIWRILSLPFLLLSISLTFESIFTGFEQYFLITNLSNIPLILMISNSGLILVLIMLIYYKKYRKK